MSYSPSRLFLTVKRIRSRLIRTTRLRVFTVDFETLLKIPVNLPPTVRLSMIGDDQGLQALDRVAVQDGFRSRLDTMRQHLAEDGEIMVALASGEPVAWQFFRPRKQTTFLWLHLQAQENVLFGFGAYTVKAWRGHRLMSELSRFAAVSYRDKGFRRQANVAEVTNRSALRVRIHRGDSEVGWISRVRFPGGLTLVMSDAGNACGVFDASNPYVYTVHE